MRKLFMAREMTSAKKERTMEIIAALKRTYPTAHCELNFSNALELLIATILSAQCTDKRVNIVTKKLFEKYRVVKNYADADLAELDNDIRSINFHQNKARNIKAACQSILENHGGKVPRTMEQLIELNGVGRKTANVVLGNVFNVNTGIVVDTHVARLSFRLGLTLQASPHKIEIDLMKRVPQNDWTLFSHLLIWHGRRRCFSRKPDCANCEMLQLCPRLGVKEKLAAKIQTTPLLEK